MCKHEQYFTIYDCRNKLKHNCHISIMQWYFNFDILDLVVETGGEV